MSSPHRVLGAGLGMSVVLALATGCSSRTVCAGVACSGHGRCVVDNQGKSFCSCDPGYYNIADLQCAALSDDDAPGDAGTYGVGDVNAGVDAEDRDVSVGEGPGADFGPADLGSRPADRPAFDLGTRDRGADAGFGPPDAASGDRPGRAPCLGSGVTGAALVGEVVVFGRESCGLELWDLSVSGAPLHVGSLRGFGVRRVAAASGRAVAVTTDSSLLVADISAPERPVRVSELVGVDGTGVDLGQGGDLAAVASPSRGLQLIDLRDASAPRFYSATSTPGLPYDVVLHERWAVVHNQYDPNLTLVDVIDPSTPVTGASLSLGREGYMGPMALSWPLVLLNTNSTLWLVDLAQPDAPVLLRTYENTFCYCLDFAAPLALACVGGIGFFEVLPDAPIIRLGTTISSASPPAAVLLGDRAVAYGGGAVHDIDLSDPQAPVVSGVVRDIGQVRDLVWLGDKLWMVDGSHLLVVDASAPGDPKVIDQTGFGGASYISLSGTTAYLSSSSGTVCAYDLSDFTAPRQQGCVEIAGALDLAAGDGVLLVNTRSGLSLVSAGPDTLEVLGEVELAAETFFPTAPVASGAIAYVAGDTEVYAIDVSDAAAPEVRGTLALEIRQIAFLDAGRLLMLSSDQRLLVVDASLPYQPSIVGQITAAAYVAGFGVRDDKLYFTQLERMLVVDVSRFPDSVVLFDEPLLTNWNPARIVAPGYRVAAVVNGVPFIADGLP